MTYGSRPRRQILSWCLYDWANSAFVLTVVSGFFPVFFKSYYCVETDMVESTFRLGAGNTAAGIAVAALSLFFGAVSGSGARAWGKKRFLGIFAGMGILSTVALYWAAQGDWVAAIILFALGNIGFSCANLFYDALLLDVADEKNMDFVSSMGFALGYIGGVILFGFCVWMTVAPDTFGFADVSAAIRTSYLCVAAWWAVFSIPIFMFVKEKRFDCIDVGWRQDATPAHVVNAANKINTINTIKKTFASIIRKPALILFLCAYWLYFDGVNTFIRMAVDFGLSIGFGQNVLMAALVVSQLVAFPSSILFGYLSSKTGTGRMISVGVLIYVFISGFGSFLMRTEAHFVILAAAIGLAQGGIQALSRSYFGKLIPAGESAEYFSFYNIVSRLAVIGPMVVGLAAMAARGLGVGGAMASRVGMSAVNIFFISGLILLLLAERARLQIVNNKS